jgi:hypothetical protein
MTPRRVPQRPLRDASPSAAFLKRPPRAGAPGESEEKPVSL